MNDGANSSAAKRFAEMALALDFEVTVCDPRDEYSSTWDVRGTNYVRDMPDDTVLAMQMDPHSAVVAVIDKQAQLMERVSYSAYGVGLHRWPGDVTNDGGCTSADQTAITTLANANGNVRPYYLSRLGATNWTLTAVPFTLKLRESI